MSDLGVQEPQQQVIDDFLFQAHICTHTAAISTIQSVCLGYAPEVFKVLGRLRLFIIIIFTELMHF